MTLESTPRGKPLVYYTHTCPPAGLARLQPWCDVSCSSGDTMPSNAEVATAAGEAVAICHFVNDLIDEDLIARCAQLRILAGFGKGHDNVDVAAATRRGVWVTNVPTALTETAADFAWALLMAVARNLVPADRRVRSGTFAGWQAFDFIGHDVHGKVLGVMGFGLLGRALARRARGFDMDVRYWDRRRAERGTEEALAAAFVDRDVLLRESDFVVLALPLTPETYHVVGSRELSLMKTSAYLINPARGSEVDESAVARALATGEIAGYAADVFEVEDKQCPTRPGEIDPGLRALPSRTLLTPHIGTAVEETRTELARYQAACVLQALRGLRPDGAVNDVAPWGPLIGR